MYQVWKLPNKLHHTKFVCQRMFQHVRNAGAMALYLISTFMQSLSQNMKVVEVFFRVP